MTAVGVAYIRAQESLRPDRLFDDPIAARLVEVSGWTPPSEMLDVSSDTTDELRAFWGTIVAYVIVRTRFLDEYAEEAWKAGVRQFVILGAGLDARAFRLPWPQGTRLFEVDVPKMIRFKEDALLRIDAVSRCERIAVGADLTEQWLPALQRSGFDPLVPTAWMAEGLLIYFTPEENETLMQHVGSVSAAGSRIGMTLARKGGLEVPNMPLEGAGAHGEMRSVPELWLSESPDDPIAWLHGHGWNAEVFDSRERAEAYGRPLPSTAPEAALRALVRAARL